MAFFCVLVIASIILLPLASDAEDPNAGALAMATWTVGLPLMVGGYLLADWGFGRSSVRLTNWLLCATAGVFWFLVSPLTILVAVSLFSHWLKD